MKSSADRARTASAMRERRLLSPILLSGTAVVAMGLWATTTTAEDAMAACTAAHDGAQERQASGHLREARELLLQCAKPSCGRLRHKCASEARRRTSEIASIVFVVTDDTGAPLVDVHVTVDGESLTTRLDGHALPVDPGVHAFSFDARVGPWPGREVSTTQKVTVVQGQRGAISIALPAPNDGASSTLYRPDETPAEPVNAPTMGGPGESPYKAAPGAPSHRDLSPAAAVPEGGPSAFVYVLGGVGLLGLGAAALLTYWGKTDNDALSQCAPNCAHASVDHIRRMYLAADLSFGGGGVALGIAAVLFATSRRGDVAASATPTATPARTSYGFDVQPTRSGAFASLKGAF